MLRCRSPKTRYANANCSQGHGRLKLHWNKRQNCFFICGDTFFVLDMVENRDSESITQARKLTDKYRFSSVEEQKKKKKEFAI